MTAAARELNYAQPSISHHLARLEAETGTKLLQRAGRGVRLTEAGRLLADRAAEVLGRLDAAENELAAHAGLRRGRVRLAAFPSALGTIVPAAAARLQAEHPGLEIRLTEAEPPEALRMLRAGDVDVALVFRHEPGPGRDAAEASRARLLLDEPIFLVTPASRPGAAPAGPAPEIAPAGDAGPPRQAPAAPGPAVVAAEAAYTAPRPALAPSGPPLVTPRPAPAEPRPGPAEPRPGPAAPRTASVGGADLAAYAGERWIAGCERCRSHLLEQCARAGFTPNIAFTTDDYVAVQALVAAGLGITTLPGLALRAARHRGVRAAPLAGARRYVYAVTYGAPPDPPPTARLLDALTAAASGEPGTTEPGMGKVAAEEMRIRGSGGPVPATAVPAGTVSGAAGGTTSP